MTNKKSMLIKILTWILIVPTGIFILAIAAALLTYPAEYVYRVFAWTDSDVFDYQKFPEHPLQAAPTAFKFEVAPDERVPTLFSQLAGVEDWEVFLEENKTQAFIVI